MNLNNFEDEQVQTRLLGSTISDLTHKDFDRIKRKLREAKNRQDAETISECEITLRRMRQDVFKAEDAAVKACKAGDASIFKFPDFKNLNKALIQALG